MFQLLDFSVTGNLDEHGAFTSAWHGIRDLMFSILETMQAININGVSLLYINLGFVLLITLFAILLPVLKMGGANELVPRSKDSAREISNSHRNAVIARRGGGSGNGYKLDSNGKVHRN